MRIYRIILPVGDINRAERFYAKLFKSKGQRVSPGRHYFDIKGIILACYDPVADGDVDDPTWKHHRNQYIYIAVTNLEETFEMVKKMNPNRIDERIEKMPWGESLFYANDPWGTPLCFVDNTTVFTGSNLD